MTTKIKIKPLSINAAFKGRRFKTDDYKNYEKALLLMLPKKLVLPTPPFQVYYEFGFSSTLSDFDNPVKLLTDILQKKYKFNDKLIYKAVIVKKDVSKGEEYLLFDIISYEV